MRQKAIINNNKYLLQKRAKTEQRETKSTRMRVKRNRLESITKAN